MNFCIKCGDKLKPDANFCQKCGVGVNAIKPTSPKLKSDPHQETRKTSNDLLVEDSVLGNLAVKPKQKRRGLWLISAAVGLVAVLSIIFSGFLFTDNSFSASDDEARLREAMQSCPETRKSEDVPASQYSENPAKACWDMAIYYDRWSEPPLAAIIDGHTKDALEYYSCNNGQEPYYGFACFILGKAYEKELREKDDDLNLAGEHFAWACKQMKQDDDDDHTGEACLKAGRYASSEPLIRAKYFRKSCHFKNFEGCTADAAIYLLKESPREEDFISARLSYETACRNGMQKACLQDLPMAVGEPILRPHVRPKFRVPPEFPPEALLGDYSGHCILNFDTNKYGFADKLNKVKCTDNIYRNSAIDSVKQSIFEPEILDGVLHPSRGIEQKITFTLTDEHGKILPEP